MKKIKTIEKQIFQFNATNELSPAKTSALSEMLRFWELYDQLFHTDHVRIINALYSPAFQNKTQAGKAFPLHVNERTLERFRHLYIESYLVCCKRAGVPTDNIEF